MEEGPKAAIPGRARGERNLIPLTLQVPEAIDQEVDEGAVEEGIEEGYEEGAEEGAEEGYEEGDEESYVEGEEGIEEAEGNEDEPEVQEEDAVIPPAQEEPIVQSIKPIRIQRAVPPQPQVARPVAAKPLAQPIAREELDPFGRPMAERAQRFEAKNATQQKMEELTAKERSAPSTL